MNESPPRPDLSCPVPDPGYASYHTDLQSALNVSRKDKFLLIMDIPPMLKPYLRNDVRDCNQLNLDKLQLTIWGHVVPEVKIPKLDKKFGGQTFKVSSFSRDTYPPVTVNYTIDNTFDNYFILYQWLNLQNDESLSLFDGKHYGSDRQQGFVPDYTSTIRVYALDEYDKPVMEFVYIHAFPTGLGSITASHKDSAENQSTFTFEFSVLNVKRSREFFN